MPKIVLVLLLGLILLAPMAAAENLEFVGGVTINNLAFQETVMVGSITQSEGEGTHEVAASGFFLGGRYWFNEYFAVGLGLDSCSSQRTVEAYGFIPLIYMPTVDAEEMINLSGPYVEAVYKISNMFRLIGGLAFYDYSREYEIDYVTDMVVDYPLLNEKGSGTGLIFGAELDYPLSAGLSLVGQAGFRSISIDISETSLPFIVPSGAEYYRLDVGGYRIALGLSYQF